MKTILSNIIFWICIIQLMNINLIAQDKIYYGITGTIRFESDAPLELIIASSDELKGALDISKREFAFTVPNNSFTGFNSPLQQEHFYENYIESDKYPNSTFTGKIIEPLEQDIQGEFKVRAKGILNIHGEEQERIINSTITLKNDQLILKSEFSILLKDHNIEIPRVVNHKIAEEIVVAVIITMNLTDIKQ